MLSTLLAIASFCGNTQTNRWNGFLNYKKEDVIQEFNVHVTFKNNASFPVSLEKIVDKRQTHVENMVTILPNEKRKVTCLIGDTFSARAIAPGKSFDETLLLVHDVSRVYISDNKCEDTTRINCKRVPFTADKRWTPPDSLMFSNRNKGLVNLFYYDGTCEEHVGTIQENNDHHLQSTLGHLFRIRDANDTLLQEHTLSEIIINDLQSEEDFDISDRASMMFDTIHLNTLQLSVQKHEEKIAKVKARLHSPKLFSNETYACETI